MMSHPVFHKRNEIHIDIVLYSYVYYHFFVIFSHHVMRYARFINQIIAQMNKRLLQKLLLIHLCICLFENKHLSLSVN